MKWLYWLVYRGFDKNEGPWQLIKIFETDKEANDFVRCQGKYSDYFKVEAFKN